MANVQVTTLFLELVATLFLELVATAHRILHHVLLMFEDPAIMRHNPCDVPPSRLQEGGLPGVCVLPGYDQVRG